MGSWIRQPIYRYVTTHITRLCPPIPSRWLQRCLAWGLGLWILGLGLGLQPAWAALNDDRFEGNIFALYAGNGSLVPPRSHLKDSRRNNRVAIILFYLDDSRDSKTFAPVYSQIQAGYGRVADLIPVLVDSLDPSATYTPDDEGYYYRGLLPQLVIIDQDGQVVLDEVGQVPYEQIDDRLRDLFGLLPRSESQTLQRRSFNEFSSELVSN